MVKLCVVKGCPNGESLLSTWRETDCDVHQCSHGSKECTCDPPFKLFAFPSKKYKERRERWIQLVGREVAVSGQPWKPTRYSIICSMHFVDRKPSRKHPYPTLKLGHDEPGCTTDQASSDNENLAISAPAAGVSIVSNVGASGESIDGDFTPNCSVTPLDQGQPPPLEWSQHVLTYLHRFQQQGLFCDATLEAADGARLTLHRCVMCAASPLLQSLLEQDTGGSCCIRTHIQTDVLSDLVRYMYTGDTGLLSWGNSDVVKSFAELGMLRLGASSNTVASEHVAYPRDISLELGNSSSKVLTSSPGSSRDNQHSGIAKESPEPQSSSGNTTHETTDQIQQENDACAPEGSDGAHIPLRNPWLDDTKLQCFICNEVFSRAVHLADHVKEAHNSSTPLTERQTGPSGNGEALLPVFSVIKDEVIPGKDSGITGSDALGVSSVEGQQDDLIEGMCERTDKFVKQKRSLSGAGKLKPVSMKCQYCEETFLRNYLLKKHMAVCHSSQNELTCNECKKTFESKLEKYFHHQEYCREFICKTCGKRLPQERALKFHEKYHVEDSKKPFQCPHTNCGKGYFNKRHFECHLSTHFTATPYLCEQCGQSFPYRKLLRTHVKRAHVPKMYKCEPCKLQFCEPYELYNHMKRMHMNVDQFKCKVCDKVFSCKADCKIHQRTHVNPYRCTVCNQKHNSRSALDIHMLIHTGEEPFSCVHCGKTFNKKRQCMIHERKHTEVKSLKCRFCEKMFHLEDHRVLHERVHTGEKPHKCTFCDKTFAQRTSVKLHERKYHEHLCQFTCRFCTKRFALQNSVTQHEHKCHKDEIVKLSLAIMNKTA